MSKSKEQIIADLTKALPYFRGQIKAVRDEGKTVKMGILSVNPDGSGKVEMQFDCDELFNDIATLIELPEQSDKDDMRFKARKFLGEHGLTVQKGE